MKQSHYYGGEVTTGVLGECYGYCITEMSILHLINCEPHRNRVINMGEKNEYID